MKALFFTLFASIGLFVAGCAGITSPVVGSVYTGAKYALMTTGTTLDESKKKVGEATCRVTFGFATGDCSIETAVKNAGIKTIHYVDSDVFNLFGLFGSYTIIVTGE